MDGGEDKRDTDKEYSGLVDFDRYRAVQRKWLEAEIRSEAFRKTARRPSSVWTRRPATSASR
jgi:acid phosphatase type 7